MVAHTNASDTAWLISRPRAVDITCSIRVNAAIIEWLRAMKAWNGVEYSDNTIAQRPRSALSTDQTRADIVGVMDAGVIYRHVVL